jgi:hypothetical protein
MAKGILLPRLSDNWSALAPNAGPSGLFCVSPPDILNDWNNPGEDADTSYDLVASDDRQERPFG